MLAARRGRSVGARREDAERLAAVGLAPLPPGARVVAAYAAFGTEPGTRPLIEALHTGGVRVLLPVLLPDGDLDWAPFEGWEALVPGLRGLLQPASPPRGIEAIAAVDLAFVPALAVDRAGRRLGRGGGSFDRALCRADRSRTVAVVYDDEVIAEVPTEPHDCRVGGALTPSGLVQLEG
jgi:5-formyltetrahydrofolate cyclo-ligase